MAVGTAAEKSFFHWFIEFPEIIERGGFDCILGNPPYLGDKALSGTYGYAFCNYIRVAYAPTGLSDLVVYFLRRIFALLKPGGFLSIITTNSIKDGDIREDGLERVVAMGGTINMGVRGVKWPGRANLVVSLLTVINGTWKGRRVLDGNEVEVITPFFETSTDLGEARVLGESTNKVFTGYYWLGDGFLLSHEQGKKLISNNRDNMAVILPVINGQELNNEPDQSPQRSIINFGDRSEEMARKFGEVFALVEEKVKPFRKTLNRQRNRDIWWLYGENRPGLTAALKPLLKCLCSARTTKHLTFSLIDSRFIFSDALNVFTTDRWDLFSVVQSTVHEVWARKYSGALKQDLRYSPSKCFDTYAFPNGLWKTLSPTLAQIGERYHNHRKQMMLSLWLGLTDIYNLFHARQLEADLKIQFLTRAKKDPQGLSIPSDHRSKALAFTYDQALSGLLELRRLHIELDNSVRNAYGWADLNLEHDFYEIETLSENDRVRYTMSPAARRELLTRLLKLNHDMAAAEAASAPMEKKASSKKKRAQDAQTLSLFTEEELK